MAHKKKAVYALVHVEKFIHFLDQMGSCTTRIFSKTTYFILVNLQAVSGGKECSVFQPVNFTGYQKENTSFVYYRIILLDHGCIIGTEL